MNRQRLDSIDLLRGGVIVLMALDHVRDYFTGARFNPLDLDHTTPAYFFTRWITHFCAPVFVFLAGVSTRLAGRRRSPSELTRFLFARGLWLIVLEMTLVSFAWTFQPRYPFGLILQVIWAIGASMVVMAGLVRLPTWVSGCLGALLIGLHNLLDHISPEAFGPASVLWHLLHVPGELSHALVLYPLLPWLGVMAAGYAVGALFDLESARRRRALIVLGLGLTAGFFVVRGINLYGDPDPWTRQESAIRTAMSFLNTEKYPPSLSFLLMTLGPALIALGAFERARLPNGTAFLITFGRVPLVFYVAHLYLLHFAAGMVGWATGFRGSILTNMFIAYPENWGFGLPVVYLVWALAVAALYPLCRWFSGLKQRRDNAWLSYL